MLVLTAARREEITALCWSEIVSDAIELTGERTKNGEPHSIPLTASAAAILGGAPRIAGSEYVFTTTGKTPVSGWSKAKRELDKESERQLGQPLAPWRLHDLRRKAATGLQRLGFPLQVIEAVLGHISGSRAGVVGIYQRHSFADEKRAALNAWAAHVEAVVSDKAAKVIPLKARAS